MANLTSSSSYSQMTLTPRVVEQSVATDSIAERGGALRSLVLCTPMVAATLLSKFSIPPYGARGIGITLPLVLGIMVLGLLFSQFRVAPARLSGFAITMALLGLSQVVRNDAFSLQSLLLLATLHLPFVLQLTGNAEQLKRDFLRASNFFQGLALLCALCAIAQFALQFVMPRTWLFPFESFLPDAYRVHLFNPEATLGYGSSVYRANGVFLFEPSYLSQLLAVSIVMELCLRNRWWQLLICGAGMLVSYSGTGLIVLALCLPIAVIAKRRWDFLILALLLMAVVVMFSQNLYLDSLLSRTHELSSSGSSGFARFVGGFYLFDQFLWGDALRTLFGYGAGSFRDYSAVAHYPVAEMPLFKMVFEFGLLGAALYFTFLGYCLFANGAPPLLALALGMTFLLNGLYVPFSHALALSLLIWTSHATGSQPVPRPVVARD